MRSGSGPTAGGQAATVGLQQACIHNAENGLRVMLEDPRTDVSKDSRPLISATEGGHINIVRLLLAHGAKSAVNLGLPEEHREGCTPLMIACQHNRFDIAELLIAEGADPLLDRADIVSDPIRDSLLEMCPEKDEPSGAFARTAMGQVIGCGAVPEMVDLLVKHGAKRPNIRTGTGMPVFSTNADSVAPGIAQTSTTIADAEATAPSTGTYIRPDGTEVPFVDMRAFAKDSNISKEKTCVACGKVPGLIQDSLVCGGCRRVSYCGKACQRAHWKTGGHREECPKLKAKAESGTGIDTSDVLRTGRLSELPFATLASRPAEEPK